VEATGRKKLIMAALWTEACLTFPALDAMREGYEVYAVADAVGGTSVTAHEMALRRIEQAGARMISVTQLFCELQRDWKRKETVPGFMTLFSTWAAAPASRPRRTDAIASQTAIGFGPKRHTLDRLRRLDDLLQPCKLAGRGCRSDNDNSRLA